MKRRFHKGFTLIELAIALVIMALLAGSALVALRVQSQRANFGQTRDAIEDAREALYNYAVVWGYLPCPAVDDTGAAGTCPANTDPNTSTATAGMLPWQELGVSGQDAWGQRLRYAVSNALLPPAVPSLAAGGNSSLVIMDGTTRLSSNGAVAFAVWSVGADAESTTSIPLQSSAVHAEPSSDDIVIWGSRYVLMGRLVQGGRQIPLK